MSRNRVVETIIRNKFRTGEGYYIFQRNQETYLLTPHMKEVSGNRLCYYNICRHDEYTYSIEGVAEKMRDAGDAKAKALLFGEQMAQWGKLQYRFCAEDGSQARDSDGIPVGNEMATGAFLFPKTALLVGDGGQAIADTFHRIKLLRDTEIELEGSCTARWIHLLAGRLELTPHQCWSNAGVYSDRSRQFALLYQLDSVNLYWTHDSAKYDNQLHKWEGTVDRKKRAYMPKHEIAAGTACQVCGERAGNVNYYKRVNSKLPGADEIVVCNSCLIVETNNQKLTGCNLCDSLFSRDVICYDPHHNTSDICPYCKRKDFELLIASL